MARIFLELGTGIGPLIRCLPVATWLRDQGHEVKYFARDNSTRYMKAVGFQAVDIDPARVAYRNEIRPDWRDADEIWGAWGFADLDWLGDRMGVWTRAMADHAPDLVLTDFGILSAISARLLGIPLAAITQSCMHVGVYGGKQSFWLPDHRPGHLSRDCINRFLAGEKASFRLERFEETFQGDATIIPSIPEFDLLEPGHQHHSVFAGPVLWDGVAGGQQVAWPARAAGRPRVFAYTGRMRDSAGNSGELVLRAVLDAARANRFDLVVSTGGMDQIPPDIGLDLPNVTVVDWVPMERAYGASDLVIHHGGHGSCLGGLKYGVPALIIPTHTERQYNARLMQKIGCGDFIDKRAASGPLVQEAVQRLLASPSVRTELDRHRRTIAEHYSGAAARAGEAVLSLLC
jgi:UDP:flavonoid glycosyltransferase YjiC (YdhE family)